MNTELTAAQEAAVEDYATKYRTIGLSTDRIDCDKARAYGAKLMKILNREHRGTIITTGPTEGWLMVCALSVLPINKIKTAKKVEETCRKWVADLTADERAAYMKQLVWPYLDGQAFAGWTAWKNFYVEQIGIKIDVDCSMIDDQIYYGPVWPLENFCVISDRMAACSVNANGLHCDGGPAVEYKDGFKIWALNGVRVPQWLAETPFHKLEPKKFAELSNVEIRREFVRKVGVEQLMVKLGSTLLDKWDDYELHSVNLGGTTGAWPYLKMKNPSIGVWHLECVPRECTTVKAALAARNGDTHEYVIPEILT